MRALMRQVYHSAFRAHLRARVWLADRFGRDDRTQAIPLPPALLRYRVSESLSTEDFLNVGKGCAWHIEQQLQESGISFSSVNRALDFGCGCGRTLRWLLEDHPETHFFGVDVDAEAIAWCQRGLSGGTFARNDPQPPLPFPAGHFDLVYCISVFTHLDERMQDEWFAELRRVLKDSGTLILTVHGEAAAQAIRDPETGATLRNNGFVNQRSRKLAGIVPDWYNTTWHGRAYIEHRLARFFEKVRYVVVPDGSQDLVVGIGRAPGNRRSATGCEKS